MRTGRRVTLSVSRISNNARIRGVAWSSANRRTATVNRTGRVTGVRRGTVNEH